jgi:4-hydroxy-2-oxoheptanedioate aldolase
MKRIVLTFAVLAIALTTLLSAQGGDPNYGKPKRLNKMVELLAADQPVYDVGVTNGGYEEGKKLAQTTNDMIMYEMEHGTFNPQRLKEFMQGLADGGPTKTGHRMPAVVVTLPFLGLDGPAVRANTWVIEQILITGVNGLMLCHTRNADAVRAFVSAARYPFNRTELKGADRGIPEGLRGSGGQGAPARIWGVSANEYMEKADPWPMNPNGELLLSLKMEDKYALENIDEITAVPGIAWGEWGPGDQSMSLMGLEYLKKGGSEEAHAGTGGLTPDGLPKIGVQKLDDARSRIMGAMKAHHIFPLHSARMDDIETLIKYGVRVTHGTNVELTNKGRALTKRQMPY